MSHGAIDRQKKEKVANIMVYDKTKFNNRQKKEGILSKMKETLAHPTVSALIYGYLKEKDLNLKDMTVGQWKEIEMDLVEIILAEVYPGEEVQEDQLNFTTLAHSIHFMSDFIETLNRNLDESGALSGEVKSFDDESDDEDKGKFEL